MVNEHTVTYHPSPSEYISVDSRIFLEFFLKPVYPTRVVKSFKFMVLRLLENTFVRQNLNLFTHGPKQNSSPGFYHNHSRQKEITHFPQLKCFKNLFFRSREGEDYRAENMTKIKLARVLVTSFDKFHHLQPLHFWFPFCCDII